MPAIVIWLDLIAGSLIGLDLFVSKKRLTAWDAKIIRYLDFQNRPKGLAGKKGLILSFAIAGIIYMVILARGLYKDIITGSLSGGDMAMSYTVTLVGVLLGSLAWAVLGGVWIKRIQERMTDGVVEWRKAVDIRFRSSTLLFIPVMIIIFIILPISDIPIPWLSLVVGFCSATGVLGVLHFGLSYGLKYLTSRKRVVARFGLSLFIISKIIQLTTFYLL